MPVYAGKDGKKIERPKWAGSLWISVSVSEVTPAANEDFGEIWEGNATQQEFLDLAGRLQKGTAKEILASMYESGVVLRHLILK